jgi:hypothetical protein
LFDGVTEYAEHGGSVHSILPIISKVVIPGEADDDGKIQTIKPGNATRPPAAHPISATAAMIRAMSCGRDRR